MILCPKGLISTYCFTEMNGVQGTPRERRLGFVCSHCDSRGNTFRYCACYTFQLKFTDGTKCDNPLTLTWGPIESRECWDVEGRNRWRWIGEKVIWNGSCLTWKVEEGTHVLRRKIAFWSWERQGNRFSRPSRIRHGQHLHLPCWSCEIIHVFLSSL